MFEDDFGSALHRVKDHMQNRDVAPSSSWTNETPVKAFGGRCC